MIAFIVVGAVLLYLFIGVGLVKLTDMNSNWVRFGKDYGREVEDDIDYGVALIITVFWPFALFVMFTFVIAQFVTLLGHLWMILMDKTLGDR